MSPLTRDSRIPPTQGRKSATYNLAQSKVGRNFQQAHGQEIVEDSEHNVQFSFWFFFLGGGTVRVV